MQHVRVAIDGGELDVCDEGAGRPIVLLHAFPLAKELWDAQARALAPHARVVRIDLRGLGRSSVTPGPYLMDALAGDVASVLDALDIDRAVIAGSSVGGYVAFAFYRLFAERCAGLALVGTRATADDAATAQTRRDLADRAEREGIAPVVDAFVPRFFPPATVQARPELVDRVRAIAAATDPRGAAAMLRGMALRVDSEDLFDEMAIPVRLVAGARDPFVPLDAPRRAAAAIANASLEILDCGHLPPLETPEAVNATLAELVRDAG